MKLLIDAGNTNWKWALEDRSVISASGVFPSKRLDDELVPAALKVAAVDAVLVSCVAAEEARQQLTDWVVRWFALQPVFAQVQQGFAGMRVCYPQPERLGVDRWLAMLAVRARYPIPAIVIDAGSAITVDYLDDLGNHTGGLIVPGLALMRFALYERTAAVKLAELDLVAAWCPACDTSSCVSHGVSAMLKGFLAEVRARAPDYSVYVSGGDAESLVSLLSCRAQIEKHLVFEGLMQLGGLVDQSRQSISGST